MSSSRKQLSLKRNLFTVHVSSSEWNCILVRMLTATSVSHPSPSFCTSLYLPLSATSLLLKLKTREASETDPECDIAGEPSHHAALGARASCRQELFPPQVTYTDLLPRPCPFSQQPAAHPLNGTLQNLTALIQSTSQNHWLSRPTPLPSQQAPPCNH